MNTNYIEIDDYIFSCKNGMQVFIQQQKVPKEN